MTRRITAAFSEIERPPLAGRSGAFRLEAFAPLPASAAAVPARAVPVVPTVAPAIVPTVVPAVVPAVVATVVTVVPVVPIPRVTVIVPVMPTGPILPVHVDDGRRDDHPAAPAPLAGKPLILVREAVAAVVRILVHVVAVRGISADGEPVPVADVDRDPPVRKRKRSTDPNLGAGGRSTRDGETRHQNSRTDRDAKYFRHFYTSPPFSTADALQTSQRQCHGAHAENKGVLRGVPRASVTSPTQFFSLESNRHWGQACKLAIRITPNCAPDPGVSSCPPLEEEG